MNQLGDSYPELISAISQTGDVTVTATAIENALAEARLSAAQSSEKALQTELEAQQLQIEAYEKLSTYANNAPIITASQANLTAYMKTTGRYDKNVSDEENLINFYNELIKSNPLFSARGFEAIAPLNGDYKKAYQMNESLIRGVLGRVVSVVQGGLGTDNDSNRNLKGRLSAMLQQIQAADSDVSLGQLTGGIVKEISEIADLKIEEIVLAISNIRENAQDYIDRNTNGLSMIESSLSHAQAMIGVQQFLA